MFPLAESETPNDYLMTICFRVIKPLGTILDQRISK